MPDLNSIIKQLHREDALRHYMHEVYLIWALSEDDTWRIQALSTSIQLEKKVQFFRYGASRSTFLGPGYVQCQKVTARPLVALLLVMVNF